MILKLTSCKSLFLLICTLTPILMMTSCKMISLFPESEENWDNVADWTIKSDGTSTIKLATIETPTGPALKLTYDLGEGGWALIQKSFQENLPEDIPVKMLIRTMSKNKLEINVIDKNGELFSQNRLLTKDFMDWKQCVAYRSQYTRSWIVPKESHKGLAALQIAFAGSGRGSVLLKNIGLGTKSMKSSFDKPTPLDPNRELPGIGIKQRRSKEMTEENPKVLEWLKAIQDTATAEKALIPSQEDNTAWTFNNVLVAMAFILKGERERAERILDFYANATVKDERDPKKQNFFLNGEARGFYQYVNLRDDGKTKAYSQNECSDRWMGDMVWLMFAYKFYEQEYDSKRYDHVTQLITDLILSWYKKDEHGNGGYVQSGWRKGDKYLHEEAGHHEGNIDAYAFFKLIRRDDLAAKINIWLEANLKGKGLPLDLYSWRVMAYDDPELAPLLDIVEYDFRYRKTVKFNGVNVIGFFSSPTDDINNIWIDGLGHMACSYLTLGDEKRGNFYANEMDKLLIDRTIKGKKLKSLPYATNTSGGFPWVNPKKGFTSAAAWYIFAKNSFNPMTLKRKQQ